MNVFQRIKSMVGSVPRVQPVHCAENIRAGTTLLVDVREPSEWFTGVAEKAALLPLSDLTGPRNYWRPFLATVGQKEIVLYCASGVRTVAAGRILAHEGFKVADGGSVEDWANAGWHITHESLVPNHLPATKTAPPFSVRSAS